MRNDYNHRWKRYILILIALCGIGSFLYGLIVLARGGWETRLVEESLVITLFLLVMFPKAVKLPSGTYWRPSIGLILYVALLFPYHYSILITFVGMVISLWKKGERWRDIWLTFGHLSLGILAARATTVQWHPPFGDSFPDALFWIIPSLAVHFLVNRFISAFIVSYRKHQHMGKQIMLIRQDLNWGYLSTYLVTICMVLLSQAYGVASAIIPVLLLYAIYSSVHYFKKASDLEQIYLTDGLTGVENRASWEYFKAGFPSIGEPGTVVFVDLDQFKGINDTWGHEIGDKILCETAQCLKEITAVHHRVFRFGGDEFLLYIPHEKNQVKEVRHMIQNKIQQQNQAWAERRLDVSMSSGIGFVSTKEEKLDELFSSIDQAMYNEKFEKKEQGKTAE